MRRRSLVSKNKSKFKLNFNRNNQDYLTFGYGKQWIDPNEFEVEINVSNLISNEDYGIIGQSVYANWSNGRWYIDSIGNYINFTQETTVDKLILSFPFEPNGVIKVIRDISGNVTLYHNNNIKDSGHINGGGLDSDIIFTIGVFNDTHGSAPLFSHFMTGTVHWAKITSFGYINYINLNEGSGRFTTTSQGDIGEIKTSHVDDLAYVDNVMWEKDI